MFEDDDETPVSLTINKSYAKKYENWRQKEEKQKLIARYGSDIEEDSDEEPEDENAEEWTGDVEKEFLRCYSILKRRDPSIYDPKTSFFTNLPKNSTENEEEKPNSKKSQKGKKMFLKDAEIEFAMAEANGETETEGNFSKIDGGKSLAEEREEIKKSLKKALETSEDEDDGFLKKKIKNQEEKEKEEAEYVEWLKGQKSDLSDGSMKTDLKFLRDFWNDEKISERDRFLRDFILNKMHLRKTDDDEDEEKFPSYDELINENDEEDEEELEKAEEFERKFNFRFQEPDAEFLKRYPRTIEDSVRRKDDRRKLKRAERKKRKELERQQKVEEIKRLKNLKKKEIFEKIKKIQTVAADDQLPWNMDDLEADFDPKEYDRRMKELFNEDYYKKGEEEEEKPEVLDEELEVENWDEPEKELKEEQTEKKGRKKSKLSKAIRQEKPVFDPKEKSFEEYFNEFYKLDCEDFIGDLPVRFQYREVEPNDFGLTIDEILAAEDRELNAWCSLKKACQYRGRDEEIRDKHVFRNKAKNFEKKKKILATVYQTEAENEEEKRPSEKIVSQQNSTNKSNSKVRSSKKNKKNRNLSDEQRLLVNMSDERLQMYNVNPTRFKNFVRYNKDKIKK